MKYRAKKSLGQNFLQDQNILAKIVAHIDPQPTDHLVEIGPGRAALTDRLIGRCRHLSAIELDRDLYADLKQKYADQPRFSLYQSNALDFDFCALDKKIRVVGNLPYNISTPILFHLLAHLKCIQDLHLMLQKEVVDRMVAQPNRKTYGRLSVMVQWHCQLKPLFNIGPKAFYPQPKVESTLVRLQPHAQPLAPLQDLSRLELIVRLAFNQRRKTLRNALKSLFSPAHIQACGIDPQSRAEQLSLLDFVCLANQGV